MSSGGIGNINTNKLNQEFLEEERNKTLETDFIEKEGAKLYIFGMKFDQVGLIVNVVAILLWFFIWKYCGLFKLNCKILNVFFVLIVIFRLVQLYVEKDEKTAYITEEQAFVKNVREMSLVVFGATMLLVTVLLYQDNFVITESKRINYLILSIVNILLILSIIALSIPNKANYFRALRIGRGMLYNTACFMLITFFLKFLCKN